MKKITLSIIVTLLACAFSVRDQGDPVSKLRDRIDSFNSKYQRTKLDLFFNQPKYSPGDTALVRTLYLTAGDLKPVEGRQIIYVELFDSKGARVFRNQILVVNGLASNALIIPDDFSPGIYLLVAYSDWMRNLDQALFFKVAETALLEVINGAWGRFELATIELSRLPEHVAQRVALLFRSLRSLGMRVCGRLFRDR